MEDNKYSTDIVWRSNDMALLNIAGHMTVITISKDKHSLDQINWTNYIALHSEWTHYVKENQKNSFYRELQNLRPFLYNLRSQRGGE